VSTPVRFDQSGRATEYQLTVVAEVQLVDRTTPKPTTVWQDARFNRAVAYPVSPDATDYFDREVEAMNELSRDFARALVGAKVGQMGYRDMRLYGTMFDGVSLRSYIAGVQAGSESTNDTPLATPQTAKIGLHADNTGPFTGMIDEVRISRVARSLDFIRAHVRSTSDAYLTYGPEEPN